MGWRVPWALFVCGLGASGCGPRQTLEGDGELTAEDCAPDDGGITLPGGFCAMIVADDLAGPRQMAVTAFGDLFVATARGGIVSLRDRTSDGKADVTGHIDASPGTGLAYRNGFLYFAEDERVMRYPLLNGDLLAFYEPQILVGGLPTSGAHATKSLALDTVGNLYVSIGSASDACQIESDTPGSLGIDPCPELETRAGIWRFDTRHLQQAQSDGVRVASGLRSAVAMAVRPGNGAVYAVQRGRERLDQSWPSLFGAEEGAGRPAEELFRVSDGEDYGWPYCYYDSELAQKVLAPEYGGDGTEVGPCAGAQPPLLAFPARWSPTSIHFYRGAMFPERYRGGAFVAFNGGHSDGNESPGYNVVFVPFVDGAPSGEWEVFADAFAGDARRLPEEAAYRPFGLIEGPDGSLYISADQGGRIWRVIYHGP